MESIHCTADRAERYERCQLSLHDATVPFGQLPVQRQAVRRLNPLDAAASSERPSEALLQLVKVMENKHNLLTAVKGKTIKRCIIVVSSDCSL